MSWTLCPRLVSCPPTAAQMDRWREEHWRHQHDDGYIDPVTGELIRLSVRCIAALWRVPPTSVQDGIRRARNVREALASYDAP
jgi:hypothetical protein